MARVTLEMPLNRVEGDLDIKVVVDEGRVVEARSIGTLYRGFENMLRGRDPLDALVITPRICGICSITHLTAAAKALEAALYVTPPPQAVRLRNLSILAETVQSDLRQVFLMFLPDFAHDFYADHAFHAEAVEHYAPLKGKGAIEALRATKDILKVVAIIGGQWPHTSHMVPGGISTIPSIIDLTLAQTHLMNTRRWYEQAVLGGKLGEFTDTVTDYDSLLRWVATRPQTHLARFLRLCEAAGVNDMGRCYPNYLSYGAVDDPDNPHQTLIRAGVRIDGAYQPLAPEKICEDLTHSWYRDQGLCEAPCEGHTEPMYEKAGGYSWAKAPRYDRLPMQTGPLAQAIVDREPLICDLESRFGDTAMVRALARLLRPSRHLAHMCEQMRQVLQNFGEATYQETPPLLKGEGIGLVEAARGALGHWLKVEDGRISHYQIITPTAWNGSPRDMGETPGPWERAITGLTIRDADNPMEMGHVIRSFDPCLVCTVHGLTEDGTTRWRWVSGVA